MRPYSGTEARTLRHMHIYIYTRAGRHQTTQSGYSWVCTIYTPTCRAGRGALRQIVRVGHPARLLPAVVGVSLDAKLAASDGGAIVRDIKKEIDDAQAERRLVRGRGRVRP